MPKYRFTWDNFDDSSVNALATAFGYRPQTDTSRREWLAATVKRPNDQFVKLTKSVIEDVWLQAHPGTARSIVDHLLVEGVGPHVRPESDQVCPVSD